ncbi:hypothetical protein D3C78_1972360 [compost metagenome]
MNCRNSVRGMLVDKPMPTIHTALTVIPKASSSCGANFFVSIIMTMPPINIATPLTIIRNCRNSLG